MKKIIPFTVPNCEFLKNSEIGPFRKFGKYLQSISSQKIGDYSNVQQIFEA